MMKRLKIGVAALAGLLALGFGGAALAGATQAGAKHATKHAAKHATRHATTKGRTVAAKTTQAAPDTETNDGPDQQGEHLDPGERAGGLETPDANEKPEAGETNDGPDTDNVQQ
jgi:hypothetical protein